jgi:hypothetical protein
MDQPHWEQDGKQSVQSGQQHCEVAHVCQNRHCCHERKTLAIWNEWNAADDEAKTGKIIQVQENG